MSTPVSVMTYNICDGGAERLPLIAEVIALSGANLVLLNEADDESAIRQLARELDMSYRWARGSGTKHIALLSRLPIVRWAIYNRRPITQALLETEIELRPGVAFNLYGVHLLPYYMLLPYEVARWRTISAIVKLARTTKLPHLILGDFNAVTVGETTDLTVFPPRTQRLRLLQANRMIHFALRPLASAGYTDTFRVLHPKEQGRTWLPNRLSARLDYIFADAQMTKQLVSCHVVTAAPAGQASDHFPLLAEFEI